MLYNTMVYPQLTYYNITWASTYPTGLNPVEFIEFRRTNYGKYAIGFKGAIIWNKLPSNERNIGSYNMFKNKVKQYLIKKQL